MTDLSEYKGRHALVTGAGDGIGKMLAKQLADAGMKVCVQDIRGGAAQAVADEIGTNALPLSFDVSDRDACFQGAETQAENGPLNLLWINAGVGIGAPVIRGKSNAVEWAFGVNVMGAIWTAQAFRPLMEEATGPRHVGITAVPSISTSHSGRAKACTTSPVETGCTPSMYSPIVR